MKILNYETFLETMQFAVLKNAQNLAKQEEEEEERRKSKQQKEDNPTFSKKPVDDIYGEEEMEVEVEEPEMEVEEPEMEPNFKEITVPGTNLNLDEFEKKLGTPITQYELSEDGKQVTMINRRPIVEVVAEEFPEG